MNWTNNRKLHVLADQAIFSGASFLLTILIARQLSVSDFGVYAAYVLVIYLAVSAVSAWTIQVFQVAVDKTPAYLSFIFWAQLLLLLLGILLFAVINNLIGFTASHFALLFGFGFVMHDFGRKLLLALDKTLATLLLDAATSCLLLLSFFVFQNRGNQHVDALFGNFGLVYLVSLLLLVLYLKPVAVSLTAIKSYVKLHLSMGKWLFLTAVSQWWAGNLFVVSSGIYLGAEALGALRLSQSLFGVLNVLLQAFENYVLPQTAMRMQGSYADGISYLKSMNRKLALVFIPVLLGVAVFAQPVLVLAGGVDYAGYAFVLRGLCILYVFIFLSQPIRFIFRSLQLNNHFLYAYLLSLGFAIASAHWLLSNYGLQGVIAGLIGSQVIVMAYWTIILQTLKNRKTWKSSTSY